MILKLIDYIIYFTLGNKHLKKQDQTKDKHLG